MGSVNTLATDVRARDRAATERIRNQVIVVLFAAIIFLGSIASPPSLMDDVDAVQAQIARNMLTSGDWVTARLDRLIYIEKAPLKYWIIASFFKILGVHDWVARLPIALTVIMLCWLTARMGAWAFSEMAGLCAGIALATSVGLFLFTRILLPDVMLTLAITLALWSFLRALDEDKPRSRRWPLLMGASIGCGLLLKGLIAAVFPVGAAFVYLLISRQLFQKRTWRRLRLFEAAAVALAVAAPWHVLATLRNPPYFAFTLHSGAGEYHGFFWFYFINEHVLRFLNLRYPRDYNTVPRLYFWLLHLLWLFPWSVFFPALIKLDYRGAARAARMRLMALCWTGFLLLFFTFSSTQEYYSMPCYPALALLLGCAMAEGGRWLKAARAVLFTIATLAAAIIAFILIKVWNLPTPGDIANALAQHPDAYTLSLGHMGDLTLASFAYLRGPLMLAGVACIVGAAGLAALRGLRAYLAIAVMMVLFAHAARAALVVFDPYLSSRPLADALLEAPPGQLIEDNGYYTFSSVFYYANRNALLLNGRKNNLEYGSYAPGAPQVFIDDAQLRELWRRPDRYYLLIEGPSMPRIEGAVGREALFTVAASGGKFLLTNHAYSH